MWRKFRKQTSRRVKEENKKRNTNEGRKKKDEETFNGVRGDKLYESKEEKKNLLKGSYVYTTTHTNHFYKAQNTNR